VVLPFPVVPEDLIAAGIGLRLQADGELPFLRALYISTRWEEMAATNWSNEEKLAFLSDQFALQDLHYTRYYAETMRIIVTNAEQPIGRLYLHGSSQEIRIVDISLLPSHRGRGIGGALLRGVFGIARARNCAVTIHVEHVNPARRLYDRLGFVFVAGDGIYHKMEWRP
jgi:ribosomal protein S18 acetylase RimI-like enzyme